MVRTFQNIIKQALDAIEYRMETIENYSFI